MRECTTPLRHLTRAETWSGVAPVSSTGGNDPDRNAPQSSNWSCASTATVEWARCRGTSRARTRPRRSTSPGRPPPARRRTRAGTRARPRARARAGRAARAGRSRMRARGPRADDRVPGLREERQSLRGGGSSSSGARSSVPSLKSAGAPSGRASAAAKRRMRSSTSAGTSPRCGGVDLEQVAQHDEVVDGTPLVVAAVGQHLLRQLARRAARCRSSSRCRPERGAAEHERPGVADHVVAEDVVLDVALEVQELAARGSRHGTGGASGASASAASQFPTRVESGYGCHASPGRGGFAWIQALMAAARLSDRLPSEPEHILAVVAWKPRRRSSRPLRASWARTPANATNRPARTGARTHAARRGEPAARDRRVSARPAAAAGGPCATHAGTGPVSPHDLLVQLTSARVAAGTEKCSLARWRAASPICRRSSESLSSRSSADRRAAGSRGATSTPVTPSSIASARPPTRVATTGRP